MDCRDFAFAKSRNDEVVDFASPNGSQHIFATQKPLRPSRHAVFLQKLLAMTNFLPFLISQNGDFLKKIHAFLKNDFFAKNSRNFREFFNKICEKL